MEHEIILERHTAFGGAKMKTPNLFDVWQDIGRANDAILLLKYIKAAPTLIRELELEKNDCGILQFIYNDTVTDEALRAYFVPETLDPYIVSLQQHIQHIEIATATYILDQLTETIRLKHPTLLSAFNSWKVHAITHLTQGKLSFEAFMQTLMQDTELGYDAVADETTKQEITQSVLNASKEAFHEIENARPLNSLTASLFASMNPHTQRPQRKPGASKRPGLEESLFASWASEVVQKASEEDTANLDILDNVTPTAVGKVKTHARNLNALEALRHLEEGDDNLSTSIEFHPSMEISIEALDSDLKSSVSPPLTDSPPPYCASSHVSAATPNETAGANSDNIFTSLTRSIKRAASDRVLTLDTRDTHTPDNPASALSNSIDTLRRSIVPVINKPLTASYSPAHWAFDQSETALALKPDDGNDVVCLDEETDVSRDLPAFPSAVAQCLRDKNIFVQLNDALPLLTAEQDNTTAPIFEAAVTLQEKLGELRNALNLKQMKKLETFRQTYKELLEVEESLISGTLSEADYTTLGTTVDAYLKDEHQKEFARTFLEAYRKIDYMFKATFFETLLTGESFVMALYLLTEKLKHPNFEPTVAVLRELSTGYDLLFKIITDMADDPAYTSQASFLRESRDKLFHPVQTFMRFRDLIDVISKNTPEDFSVLVDPAALALVYTADSRSSKHDMSTLVSNITEDGIQKIHGEIIASDQDKKINDLVKNVQLELKLFTELSGRMQRRLTSPTGSLNAKWKALRGGTENGRVTGESVKSDFAMKMVGDLKKELDKDAQKIKKSGVDPTFKLFQKHFPREPKLREKLMDGKVTARVINAMQPEDEAARRLMYLLKVIEHLKTHTKTNALQHAEELDHIRLSAEGILMSGTYNKLDSAKRLFYDDTSSRTCINYLLNHQSILLKLTDFKKNRQTGLNFEALHATNDNSMLRAVVHYLTTYQQRHLNELPMPERLTDARINAIFPESKLG